MSRALQKSIHGACRQLGLDSDARRDLQLMVTGKESMRDMSEPDLRKVLEALKQRGLKVPSKAFHKAAPRADLRLVHVLWRKLGEAGALRDPSRTALNAFIRKRFGENWGADVIDVDAIADAGHIATIIDALVSWCDREGVELDRAHIREGSRSLGRRG